MTDAVKLLLLKKETVYNTDAIPTPAANAWVTRNFRSGPIEVDKLDRNLDTGTWGSKTAGITNERRSFSFEAEMASSGAAGTAPRWMEGLEGCGMAAPVVTAGVKVEQSFALSSVAQSSLSARDYVSDQLRKATGVRGSWSLDWTAGAYPFFNFTMLGLVPAATPFSTLAPTGVDLSAWKAPVEVNNANTVLTLDGFAVVTRSLQINSNLDVKLRALVGARYINRGPHAADFRMVVEAPTLAAKDYVGALRAGTEMVLHGQNGTVAGAIVEIDAPKAQLTGIEEGEEDGKQMWTLSGQINVGAGGDELKLTAR